VPSLLLVAAFAIAGPGLSLPARLALIVAAERIPVPVALKPADMVFEPMTGSIELRRLSNPTVVAQKMALAVGQLCPTIETTATSVVVRCRTKRIDAQLVVERGKTFIEVEELRGLPWRPDSERLDVFYDPEKLGFGGACPGTMLAGRAECALRDGRTEEATALFRQALGSGPQGSFAGVRLGDMAMAKGDVAAALVLYRRYSYGDMFGRIAAARLCELDGSCLGTPMRARIFDATDRPEPVRSELLVRGARVALFADEISVAAGLLAAAVNDRVSGACTQMARSLCRRMLLVVLDKVTGDDAAVAIETYLGLSDRYDGPLAKELLRAVAEKAAVIGAPLFGANLLAANATGAEGPGLGEHLLRTAELYLAADDLIRARVVVDYAETRASGRNSFGGPRWAAVRGAVRGANEESGASAISSFDVLATEGARDVAAAYGTIARARTVRR
jgi:hypothetical protein